MDTAIQHYKWLRTGRVDPDTGETWPDPADGAAWLASGLHRPPILVCAAGGLPYEMGDELWEVEVEGRLRHQPFAEQVPFDDGDAFLSSERRLLASRARLVRRVSTWARPAAMAFAEMCRIRVRERVMAAVADAERSLAATVRPGTAPAGSRDAIVIDHAERMLSMWRTIGTLDASAFAAMASAHGSVAASTRAATALMYYRASGETDLDRGRDLAARAMLDERGGQTLWLITELGLSEPSEEGIREQVA
jgi:hypothetical protein